MGNSNTITTISLKSDVAKELREMFKNYGGRKTFDSLNNFVKILITVGSFYSPNQLLMVKYAIEASKTVPGSKESKMAQILLSVLEQEMIKEGTETPAGVVDVRDIVYSIHPRNERKENVQVIHSTSPPPPPPPPDDLPPVEVETPSSYSLVDDEELIDDDGEENDLL